MMPTSIETAYTAPSSGLQPLDISPEQVPHGLTSALLANTWLFKIGGRHRPRSMPWVVQLPNGLPVSNAANVTAWETARRYFTARRNGLSGDDPIALATCIQETYAVLAVMRYVKNEGYENLRDFPKRKVDHLLRAAAKGFGLGKNEVIGAHQLILRFQIIRKLHYYFRPRPGGRWLNDGLTFDAFTSDEELVALAKKMGRIGTTTKDAPPEVVFNFLNASVEFVAIFAADIIKLYRAANREKDALGDDDREQPTHRATIANALLAIEDDGMGATLSTTKAIRDEVGRRTGISGKVLAKNFCTRMLHKAQLLFSRHCDAAKVRESFVGWESEKNRRINGQNKGIGKRVGLPFTGQPGKAAPWPITSVGYGKWGTGSIHAAVVDLLSSCWLILAAFMADRVSETLALTVDCLIVGLDGYYLDTPNFKTHENDSGVKLRQPCPAIVAMAVEVLLELGAEARAKTGSDKLFYIGDTHSDWVSDRDTLTKRVAAFGKRTGATSYENFTKVWRLAPHQLRRFFVTAWINYNQYGGRFPALMHFLDQNSLAAIVRYGTKPMQGKALSKERRELADRITAAVIFEGLEVEGPAAEELYHLYNRMRIRLIPRDRAAQWNALRNERLDTQVDPLPWGYCIWSKLAGAFARCVPKSKRRTGLARPESRKSECICGDGCRNFLTTDAFAPFWEKSHERHERIANNPAAPPKMVQASKRGMKVSKKYRRS